MRSIYNIHVDITKHNFDFFIIPLLSIFTLTFPRRFWYNKPSFWVCMSIWTCQYFKEICKI